MRNNSSHSSLFDRSFSSILSRGEGHLVPPARKLSQAVLILLPGAGSEGRLIRSLHRGHMRTLRVGSSIPQISILFTLFFFNSLVHPLYVQMTSVSQNVFHQTLERWSLKWSTYCRKTTILQNVIKYMYILHIQYKQKTYVIPSKITLTTRIMTQLFLS